MTDCITCKECEFWERGINIDGMQKHCCTHPASQRQSGKNNIYSVADRGQLLITGSNYGCVNGKLASWV